MLSLKSPPLSLCVVLGALLLGACEEEELGMDERPRLLSPESTSQVRIYGVSDLSGLELRITGTAVSAVLEERRVPGDNASLHEQYILLTGVAEGTASVELLLGSQQVGVVEVAVQEVDRVVARMMGDEGWDSPLAQRDAANLRFVTAGPHAASGLFVLSALNAEGDEFDGAREMTGEVVSDDPNTVIVEQLTFLGRTGFTLDFATAGSHHVTLLSDAGEFPFTFEAVNADDVVSLELDRTDSGGTYYAYGVTAAGDRVVNLSPQFMVSGELREVTGGRHILVVHDRLEDGTVQVSWNGLTATR